MKFQNSGVDVSALSGATKPKRVFKTWRDIWESEENEKGKKMDHIQAQRLLRKDARLLWHDLDEKGSPLQLVTLTRFATVTGMIRGVM